MTPSQNPFRSSVLQAQPYCMAEENKQALLAKLNQLHYFACLRGPHGTGKSTLMQELAAFMKQEGKEVRWFSLHLHSSYREKQMVLTAIWQAPHSQLHFLDGGETLGLLQWYWFCLRMKWARKHLVATTHWPSPLPTLFKTNKNLHLLIEIVKTLAGELWSAEFERFVRASFNKHMGNGREVLQDCYHYCAELQLPN